MKRIKPKYPSLRRWVREVPNHARDNYMRRYSNPRNGTLEDIVRKAIREERDSWRAPYILELVDDEQWNLPKSERRYRKVYWYPEEKTTIREALAEDDSKYRCTGLARRCRFRVPSLKRSEREWVNFYRTFPWIAKGVAVGNERFADGAKLRYVSLFRRILDEEWPENLKMWTEEQYDELVRKGDVKPF